MKELRDEQNGVRWFSERVGSMNVIHQMEFAGRTLSGGWAGPRWIFKVLVEMSEEERAAMVSLDHDEVMGVIRTHLK